ncbi:MAG TPA: uroporphyrinogen-III synthase, partial [Bryobacteraceae bacterium]|nr:uroporphyrinogen-III synthase [Bryobacteraceae bacterium]
VGTVATLPQMIEAHHLTPPATIIIGDVVSLRDKLTWFEKLPLFGKKIVVTRARSQAGELSALLRGMGAEVVELPVISLEPLEDYAALDAAIGRVEEYDWLIFTSANAVEYFNARLDVSSRDWRRVRGKLCAIGPATGAALREMHLKVDLAPARALAEGIAEAFGNFDMKGKRVLLPRAAAAREVVPEALTRLGATVDVVDAYRNVIPREAETRAREVFSSSHQPDWIVFTSSSTVKNLIAVAGRDALAGARIASIGGVTTQTAEMQGLRVAAQADEATMQSLVNAICAATRVSAS